MRIFISSLITGMEDMRRAAREAVTVLGHTPVMAEDFGALPSSPQVACLDGVRQSAAIVLILEQRYGAKQVSGLSATHEEYREARDRCPVLVFVQQGVRADAEQAAFIAEVEAWNNGLMRDGFADASTLGAKVTGALHRLELASATAPFNENEVLARTLAAFPKDSRSYHRDEVLNVAVSAGPSQTVLRPSEMENQALAEKLEQNALYGPVRIFSRGVGTECRIADDKLVITQDEDRQVRSITLDAQGGVFIRQPLINEGKHMSSVIVVEEIQERLTEALRYCVWVLDEIDRTQRLSHLVVAVSIEGGTAMLTRRQIEASPNSYSMSAFGREERPPIHLTPAHVSRPALTQNMQSLVDDLVTLLRRQWR